MRPVAGSPEYCERVLGGHDFSTRHEDGVQCSRCGGWRAVVVPPEVAYALRVLFEEGLEDFCYRVRENEGRGWEGPRMVRFGEAVETLRPHAMPGEEFAEKWEADLYERWAS